MNTKVVIVLLFVYVVSNVEKKAFAAAPSPAHPCDIVYSVSHIVIPRINYDKPTRLEEVLDFINKKYRDAEFDPPRETTFIFEYRLSKSTLDRLVTIRASNITMIQAIKQALGDMPVVLSFESGKLVFSEPPAHRN